MGPFLSIGDFDVVVHLRDEFLYVLVRRGRGTKAVSFNNESFGGFSEVRYHVRDEILSCDVIIRDMTLSCYGCYVIWLLLIKNHRIITAMPKKKLRLRHLWILIVHHKKRYGYTK